MTLLHWAVVALTVSAVGLSCSYVADRMLPPRLPRDFDTYWNAWCMFWYCALVFSIGAVVLFGLAEIRS